MYRPLRLVFFYILNLDCRGDVLLVEILGEEWILVPQDGVQAHPVILQHAYRVVDVNNNCVFHNHLPLPSQDLVTD